MRIFDINEIIAKGDSNEAVPDLRREIHAYF